MHGIRFDFIVHVVPGVVDNSGVEKNPHYTHAKMIGGCGWS